MEEMTIKEKAKCYDKAINKLRRFMEQGVDPLITRADVQDFFPELRESDDERVRKAMIKGLSSCASEYWGGFEIKAAIAYLKKQGELSNFCNKIQIGDKVTRNENGELVKLTQLQRVAKPCDEVEPKFKVGDRVIGIISDIPYFITEVCDDYYNTESGCIIMFCAQDNFKIYEQKPAWSEEDEEYYNSLIGYLKYSITNGKPETYKSGSFTDWLKSIKDRYTWKPSDEQIKSLQESIGIVGELTPRGECLKELAEQLKKLREE